MSKFRKKPMVIEAIQWAGDNIESIRAFMEPVRPTRWTDAHSNCLIIHTLEGDHRADMGDWIIKGVKGEYYPCKPDIFEMTYELVGKW